MNREQLEAHLSLLGWCPIDWGQAGATRGGIVVYLTKTKAWAIDAPEPYARLDPHVTGRVNEELTSRKLLGAWLWADYLFFPLAEACMRQDQPVESP